MFCHMGKVCKTRFLRWLSQSKGCDMPYRMRDFDSSQNFYNHNFINNSLIILSDYYLHHFIYFLTLTQTLNKQKTINCDDSSPKIS